MPFCLYTHKMHEICENQVCVILTEELSSVFTLSECL